MVRQSVGNYCLLLIGTMLILSGCSKKEDAPAPSADDTPSAATTEKMVPQPKSVSSQEAVAVDVDAETLTFDRVLDLWKAGQKEQAVQLFLRIDWKRPDIFASDSIFGISEAEFVKLPGSERVKVQQKTTEAAKAIREISKYMTAQTEPASLKGKKYRKALLACGQRLSGSDQLAIIRMVGKAVIDYVKEGLSPEI